MLHIASLTPKKVPVETYTGIFFVGAHSYPATVMKAEDDEDVGREVLQHV